MSAQGNAALTTLNNNNVVNQTAPQSITPAILGSNVLQNIIDSMWNKVDDLLTLPPTTITKAQLATAIGASSLNMRTNGYSDKQWLQITDRTDTYPLFVQINGANTISPFGIWVKAGKPLAVIMDYVNGYQGETLPFIAVFDENRQLAIPNKIIISDASKGADKVLVSDSNGQGTWTAIANYQGGVLNPAAVVSGGGAAQIMNGLAGAITPSKTGKCLIIISGEYTSDSTALDTNFGLRTGTGAAPANGAAATGTQQQYKGLRASSATLRIPFTMQTIATLTPATAYWIDIGLSNNASGTCQLFNVSISVIEI